MQIGCFFAKNKITKKMRDKTHDARNEESDNENFKIANLGVLQLPLRVSVHFNLRQHIIKKDEICKMKKAEGSPRPPLAT